ncbi:MAG: NusG domain II-containing protein [Oscillospiraceae bacterium]|nr:NusG domain II-containing protein [Oscillospiraceae bacterium]
MKLKTGDFFVVACVILLAAIIWAAPFLRNGERGASVTVECDGALVGTYLLDEDTEVDAAGCRIKIEGGKAYVADSDCPDKVCIKTGEISQRGEAIICIPNRVNIKISGDMGFDAIVG